MDYEGKERKRRKKIKMHSSSGANARHGGDDRDAALLEDGVGVIRVDGAGGVKGDEAGEGAVTVYSCIRSCVRQFISFIDR
jgi:hypothetical protein